MADAFVSPARRYDFTIKLHPGEAKMIIMSGYIERFTEEELRQMWQAIDLELNKRENTNAEHSAGKD